VLYGHRTGGDAYSPSFYTQVNESELRPLTCPPLDF